MDMLFFEHPLDELTRLSLRLEYIVSNFEHHIHQDNQLSERACIETIVNLSHLLDRPDLKNKYARELSAHIFQLENITHKTDLHLDQLRLTIVELKEYFNYFSQPGKLGLNLRENFFLNTIRQHLLYPGGEADFELPAYYFWLNSLRQEKVFALQKWFKEFSPIIDAVNLLLKLTRSKTRSKQLIALGGFHHEPLDTKSTPKLIQIKLDHTDQAYPSISAGKHRINIRFNEGRHLISEEQALRDINFDLTLCF